MKRIFELCLVFSPLLALSQSRIGSIELPDRPIPAPAATNTNVLAWNQAQPGFATLPSEAKNYLYLVNLARSNPRGFWDSVIAPVISSFPVLQGADANSLRSEMLKAGELPMFALSPVLVRTAQAHAADIAGKRAAPSHSGTDGTDFSTRMRKAGIKYCAGENIALSSNSTVMAVILLYLDIGLPEKGHRKSLLNPQFKETGIGAARYGNEQDFLVQDLSCTQ